MLEDKNDPPNNQITVQQFIEALSGEITDREKQMLLAHYHSAKHIITRNLLAFVGGYNENGVNSAYGLLARRIAQRFGYKRPEGYIWTSFLGKCEGREEDGQPYLWKMHPELIEAIEKLGWDELKSKKRTDNN